MGRMVVGMGALIIAAGLIGLLVAQTQEKDRLTRALHSTYTVGTTVAMHLARAQATATAAVGDVVAAQLAAGNAQATAQVAATMAAPTATPTPPKVPILNVCPLELFDSQTFVCRLTADSLNLAGVNNDTLVFAVNGNRFGFSSLTWRVYSVSATNQEQVAVGSKADMIVDPQDSAERWGLGDLFSALETPSGATGVTPQEGTYKIEVIDPKGAFLAATTVTLVKSGGTVNWRS